VECEAAVTRDHNREVAMRAVDVGLYVVPCHATTKKALVQEWQNRATNLRHGVAYFWKTRPGAIVGIVCRKSGIVTIDCDRGHKEGEDGVETFGGVINTVGGGEFPDCPATRTPNGGVHLPMKAPIGREIGDRVGIWPGVDIRAAGYFIAPGCVRSDGALWEPIEGCPDLFESYRNGTVPEPPEWLIEQIKRKPTPDCAPSSPVPAFTDADADRLRKWALGALNRKASELAGVQRGGRNHALNRAAFVIAGKSWCGLDEREVYDVMVWACTINRLIADDGIDAFNATFKSGWNSGILKPLQDRGSDIRTMTSSAT
jgi:putative DNA primase/helicase